MDLLFIHHILTSFLSYSLFPFISLFASFDGFLCPLSTVLPLANYHKHFNLHTVQSACSLNLQSTSKQYYYFDIEMIEHLEYKLLRAGLYCLPDSISVLQKLLFF